MRALADLVEYEANGQRARFERFMAELMFRIAGGEHIDTECTKRFGEQLDVIYANPFEKKAKPMTASEIKDHILSKIRELRGR